MSLEAYGPCGKLPPPLRPLLIVNGKVVFYSWADITNNWMQLGVPICSILERSGFETSFYAKNVSVWTRERTGRTVIEVTADT